jgi:hypothetical protein
LRRSWGSSTDFILRKLKPVKMKLCYEVTKWGWGEGGRDSGDVLTIPLSPCPQEALPGLIWDLGQQLGDLSLESGGLEQESGRSSGEHGWRGSGLPGTPQSFPLPPISQARPVSPLLTS